MEALRRVLDSIRSGLGSLTTTHKLLIACLAVLILMGMGLVTLWTSRPAMEELMPGATVEDQQRAVAVMQGAGIRTSSEGGRLMVPSSDAMRARSVLGASGALPNNKAMYFENLLSKQNWMNSRQVNEQAFRIALQNELSRMVGSINSVDSATVLIEIPERQGLGAAMLRPTASVIVRVRSGQGMSQALVDGIANIIAGSVAGLTPDRVNITDAATGHKRAASSDEASAPSVALEHAAAVEAQTRGKLEELLSYIPGVKVAVTASVDVTRSVSEIQSYLPEKQGTVSLDKRTVENTNNSSESSQAAAPGVEANQVADITRSGGSGNKSEQNETTTEKENRFGSKTERIVDPKGQSVAVAVSVNIPRGYVVKLMQEASAQPAGGNAPAGQPAAPVEADIVKKFDAEIKPSILATITPHVRALVQQSNQSVKPDELKRLVADSVSVAMIPGDVPAGAPTQAAGMLTGLIGGSSQPTVLGLGGGLIEKGVVGLLGVMALGMMIAMVRKAGKKAEAPTAEDLVGLPPALEATGDVIGEAEEGETAMAGIEVGDEEMQAQKMLEQVTEMITKDPTEAGKLIGRWINVEE